MGIRASLCYQISRRLQTPAAQRTLDYQAYTDWRMASLSQSWAAFSDDDVHGKAVLDFGCGDGALSLYLASHKAPRHVVGVDLNPAAIARAQAARSDLPVALQTRVDFQVGAQTGLPVPDGSVDTVVAFDCLEHVMSPLPIFQDWYRVLRPGGKCLIEWFPYKGPWGPHMESLIPIPWAHVVFGQQAMLRAAERIYDGAAFVPRHWDLDDAGVKKPNKWRAWSSFKEQGYINELDLAQFRALVAQSGLRIARLDMRSFGGSRLREGLGKLLLKTPLVGEYFLSFAVIELVRP